MKSSTASGRRDVSHQEFIEVWQSAFTVLEVAQRLRLSVSAVRNRRNYLTRNDVPLKDLRSSARIPDWNALAELAEELMPEGATVAPRNNGKEPEVKEQPVARRVVRTVRR